MATITSTDAQLLQDFRALFRLSLEDIDPKTIGISRSTWARIESDVEHAHTPGVTKKIAQIRALMDIVGIMPYQEARRWAVSALPDRRRTTPRALILRSPFGLGGLLTELHAQDEQIAF